MADENAENPVRLNLVLDLIEDGVPMRTARRIVNDIEPGVIMSLENLRRKVNAES
jgi:hypothetical protein